MSETRDYFDRLTQITADVVEATIDGPSDEFYRVTLIDSEGKLLVSAKSGEWWASKSRVLLQMPSASRNVIGATPVIIGPAPRSQRGLSATTPAVSRDYFDQSSVTGIDPDPLVLIAGGDPETHVIMGAGLDEAAEYVGQGPTGVPPNLTNTAPPVVTPAKVTMTISADADSPLGNFDIVVSGVKLRGALRVEAPAPGEPDTSVLWALGSGVANGGGPTLLRIAHGTMEVAHVTDLDAEVIIPVDLAMVGGSLYVRGRESIVRINSDTGTVVEVFPSAAQMTDGMCIAVWGDQILYGDAATGNVLYSFDTSTETETSWNLGVAANPFSRMHVWLHGDIAVVTNEERLITFDLLTSTLIASAPFDTVIEVASGTINDIAFLYVLRNAGGERVLSKIDMLTLAATASVAVAPNTAPNTDLAGRMKLDIEFGFVYGTAGGSTGNVAFRADMDTMAITTADLGDDSPGGVFARTDGIEVAFSDFDGAGIGGVLRLDATTMDVLRRDEFGTDVVEITRVLIQE